MEKHQLKRYTRFSSGFRVTLVALLVAVMPLAGWAQGDALRAKLNALAERDSAYLSTVNLSMSNVSISEVMRGIARSNRVNVALSAEMNFPVVCNFTGVKVVDVLHYFCSEYNLDLELFGNIVSIFPRPKPAAVSAPPRIAVDSLGLVSFDLRADSLAAVGRSLTVLSGKNVMVPQGLSGKLVGGFGVKMPFEEALRSIATLNQLDMAPATNGIYSFVEPVQPQQGAAARRSGNLALSWDKAYKLDISNEGRISGNVEQSSLADLVKFLCAKLKVDFYFSNPLDGNTSFFVKDVGFEQLLNVIFSGTKFTYRIENGVYLFGERSNLEISTTKTIQLKYRTVDTLETIIPTNLKNGVQLQTFKELNSLVITGTPAAIGRIESFVAQIDKVVPLIYIEVMIVDVNKTDAISTGIKAGLGDAPAKTSGTISPGVSMTLSSHSINNLIDGVNGFGWLNLGKVTPQFYMTINALEQKGNIKVRSTPKLSTLNGHEAKISNGQRKYYKEINTNYFGSQTPVSSNSYTWKSVDAKMEITITPVVSGDEQITMQIEVSQEEFTPREYDDAPPGTTNRTFKSLIRVKNEEMVLLGGLERNTASHSTAGLPLISRIPVLKWIFGTNTRSSEESKLSIFVKPTVIYQ